MSIKQISLLLGYQQVESTINSIQATISKSELYTNFHLTSFKEDLVKYTGLEVNLIELNSNPLPNNALFVLFDSHLPDALHILENHPSTGKSLIRKTFIIAHGMPDPHRFGSCNIAGFLSSGAFQPYTHYETQEKPINSGIVLHFWGEEKILQLLANQKSDNGQHKYLLDIEQGYGMWHFRDNIIEDLCLYLKEYISRFDEFKDIDHFDSSGRDQFL